MTEERLALAIRRLERALARAETAAEQRATRPDPGLAKLIGRHDRLRARTKEAIAAIDRLTGTA